MSSIEKNQVPVLLSIRGEQYFDGIDPDALNAAFETLSRLIQNAQNNVTGEDAHANE